MLARFRVEPGLAVLVLSMILSSVLYIFLLRTFGALPEVRESRAHLSALEAKVDSLRSEVHHERP